MYFYNGFCLDSCVDGMYKDEENYVCAFCTSPCETCYESSTYCLTCEEGTYLHNNDCVEECPEGYWDNADTRTCDTCDYRCSTCYEPYDNGNECHTCTSDDDCLYGATCNEATYVCKYSDTVCDGNDITVVGNPYCQACVEGYYLDGTACKDECPCGTYENTVELTCDVCNNACLCCYEGDSTSCSECHEGTYLLNGECLEYCPTGYYANDDTKTCDPCSVPCKTCSGPNVDDCITCYDEYWINGGECVTPCPDGSYENNDPTIPICSDCHVRCATCEDSTYTQCPTCVSPYVWFEDSCLVCSKCENKVGYFCNYEDDVN